MKGHARQAYPPDKGGWMLGLQGTQVSVLRDRSPDCWIRHRFIVCVAITALRNQVRKTLEGPPAAGKSYSGGEINDTKQATRPREPVVSIHYPGGQPGNFGVIRDRQCNARARPRRIAIRGPGLQQRRPGIHTQADRIRRATRGGREPARHTTEREHPLGSANGGRLIQ